MFDQRPARGLTSTRVSVGALSTGPTYAYAPAKTVTIEAQGAEDREMRVLRELLAAFPAFSLQDIAQAYMEADSDVNAAAELLTTRQPAVKSNGVQEVRKSLTAEKKSNVIRRQSAEQSVVGSDDLLLEKYGIGVGELINRDSSKQSNSLLHNLQSAHDGAPSYAYHLNSPTRHGVRGDNESWGREFLNKEASNGVSGDGALLLGRKKTKQKVWGGLENEVELARTTASRQVDEKLLLSMHGESFQLGMGVVRDVLDNLNGDMQKKCHENFWNRPYTVPRAGSMANSYTHQKSITDQDHSKVRLSLEELKAFFPHIGDTDLFEALQSNNFVLRDAAQFLMNATAHKRLTNSSAWSKVDHGNRSNVLKTNVHQDSGDSLVTTRPPPLRALWANVKPTIIPLKQNLVDVSLKRGLPDKTSEGKNGMAQFNSYGDFDDYGRQRLCAHEHWRLMDYYFKEAAAAYDRGERCRAVTLSEKGKEHKQLAQEADQRASQRIFQSKNKGIVNNITIDLHAQHVGEAINVLKLHLQTLCSIPSVHMLTVITGYGSHSSNGRAKIKPAVTDFLSRSGIAWEEVNEGCLTIKMMDVRDKELDISDGE